MKKFAMLTVALLGGAASYSQAESMQMPMMAAAAAPAASAVPMVDGEVRKVDSVSGLVVLKHGDIQNLAMPAMTMGYAVADKKVLEGLKIGDKVRFQAAMVKGKPTVTELKPVR